jgi:Fe-S-cluster containining protein
MTPLEKSDGVVNKNKVKFDRSLKEAKMLIEIPRKADYKADRMIVIVDELGKLVAPISSCKKGCSYCCYQAVAVSTWEVQKIAKYAKRKTTGFVGYSVEKGETIRHIQDQFAKIPCPFLIDDLCTIYPVRPFMCRTHFSISDDPTDCSLTLKPEHQVPYFNMEEFKMAWAFILIHENHNFGDIREFFE